jgi:mono/diheme cytochrome c family protein
MQLSLDQTYSGRIGLRVADRECPRPGREATETGEKEVAMKTIVALLVCGGVGIALGDGRAGSVRGGGWHQAQQETQKPEEKPAAKSGDVGKSANPVKPTAESLALGKRFYGTDCEMCHGKEGAGDGDLAVELKLKLKDLRDAAAMKEMTDEEMYKIISKGKKPMLGEEGRLNERETWDVVNYVRSLAKAKM